MSSVYGDFRPMPSPYLNMEGYGQLGSGTYGSADVPMFSQPVAPQDWTQGLLQKAAMPTGIPTNAAAAALGGGDWFSKMFSKDGPGATLLGGAGALASTFLGMKQYGLAKQTLEENKKQFQLNYDAQKQTTNTRLEDRQRARVASNAGAYQSVGDYMGANGIR